MFRGSGTALTPQNPPFTRVPTNFDSFVQILKENPQTPVYMGASNTATKGNYYLLYIRGVPTLYFVTDI